MVRYFKHVRQMRRNMDCGVCGTNRSKRTISGIPMCEDCFAKLSLLRNSDIKTIDFFRDENNLMHASKEAKAYIHSILQVKQKLIEEVKEEQRQLAKKKQLELDKIKFAKSFNEYYEYDVVAIENKFSGEVKLDQIRSILSEYSSKGWRLHSIYSNELGKNAFLGVNATIGEDILIFERRVEKI